MVSSKVVLFQVFIFKKYEIQSIKSAFAKMGTQSKKKSGRQRLLWDSYLSYFKCRYTSIPPMPSWCI